MQRFYVKFKSAGASSSAYVEARDESEAGKVFSQQYPNVRSGDVLLVMAVGPDMSWLIVSRHIVAAAIVVMASTFMTKTQEFSSAANGFGYLVGTLIGIGGISAVICGLAALFFTERQRGQWKRNFVGCFWVFSGLVILGTWTN